MDTSAAKEYFEKLKLAEKVCKGDTEKAKKLLAGDFHDIDIIKGRFKDTGEDVFGLFVMFLSNITLEPVYCNEIVSYQSYVYLVKPFEHWSLINTRIEKEKNDGAFDGQKTVDLNKTFKTFLSMKNANTLLNLIHDNDISHITDLFRGLLRGTLGYDDMDTVVDFEKDSSLTVLEKVKISIA